MKLPPVNLTLRRAQLVLMLAVLLPTVAMTGIGIVWVVLGTSIGALLSGVLVLTFCTSTISGFVLVSIFVGKGASLARVQNDFVSSVSHELRTPLTAIRLLIDSLRDGRLADAERSSVLSLLARETDRLEQLVGKVLELSKLQSGAHVYDKQLVDVSDLIEEAIAAFDAVTLTRPTPITRRIEPGLIVIGDRATLVRALVNLLVNAWKYTGDDKRIAIEARAGTRWIELLVHDNGIGIERKEQGAIYEQFHRGRAALDSGQPGVGLGLAFVRAIVRGHRGKLDFVSRPGDTVFRVRLRKRRDPVPATANAPQAAAT
jgi:two-component system, OmpR family, phosphate regulon sensor histidine kinase PhoR